MVESINLIVESAAGEESLAISRPDETSEAARDRHPAHDPAVATIDRDYLMLAIARMKDRQNRLGGMNRDLDRQIAQPSLAAGRLERPAVGQDDSPCARHPRPDHSLSARENLTVRRRLVLGVSRMIDRLARLGLLFRRRFILGRNPMIGWRRNRTQAQEQHNSQDPPRHGSCLSMVDRLSRIDRKRLA